MNRPILIPFDNNFVTIQINSDEFSVGRGLTNSFVFKELCISRCHCVFKYNGTGWILTDKSSNGTRINSQILGKNASGSIAHDDIITFTENIQYRVQHLPEPHEQNSNKRKRIDTTNINHENLVPKKISPLENRNLNCDAQNSAEIKDQMLDFCSKSGINLLTDELKREKAVNKILKEESLAMQDKFMGLQVDLFNKISTNVGLEHDNAELKFNCATLEREKEELQLQLTDYEHQTFELKSRLQSSQSTSTNVTETKYISDENKELITCVLRAEITDKECTVRTKLNNVIVRLKELQTQTNDSNSINFIREHLQEIQASINDVITKGNELNSILKNDGALAIEKMKENLYTLMESELQCSICSEIFVKATTLNCNHTFCKTCIAQWQKQKNSCPICRLPIKTSAKCLAVDNYIDQTVGNMSPSKKELRVKLKETYEASASGPSTTSKTVNRNATIVVSSDDSDSNTDIDSEDYAEYSETETYHGGYGSCFICGNPSHWANSCPRRRSRY